MKINEIKLNRIYRSSKLLFLTSIIFFIFFIINNSAYTATAIETRKPTAYTDPGGAPATTNPTNAYDTDAATFSITPFGSGGASHALTYHTWQTTSFTYSALTLKVKYGDNGPATNDTYAINYSIDGGTNWVSLVAATVGTGTTQTASVALSASQNLSLVRVELATNKVGPNDGKNMYFYDIWTEGTYYINTAPNAPTLVSPASGSYTNDNTPTLSANYSDPDTGDTGTTNYRISSGTAQNCLDNVNIVASGTSAETSDENEDTTWTPSSSIGSDQTYYWCAQNNDGVLTSSWTSMGNFILDTTSPTGLTALTAGATGTTTQVLNWTAVTESNFDHYEIWYGTNQTKVQTRDS